LTTAALRLARSAHGKQLEVKQCEYIISEQVVQEYNSCELKLQDGLVDNHGISKYESLSNAVKKQIINSIAIQKVNDKDTIEISLYPKDLGHVKIKYDIHDNVAINISVEKLTTLALLQQNASEIKEVLLKNLNNNFAPDLSFNMGNKSQDNDQNATHSTSLVERINNSKVLEVPNALMYLMHNR
jgi:ribosome-binding factor A